MNMNLKKLITLSCFSLVALNAFAKPETVTVSGWIFNHATTWSGDTGVFTYIGFSDSNDVPYFALDGLPLKKNPTYFTLVYNEGMPYSVQISNIKGYIVMSLEYDACEYAGKSECDFRFDAGNLYPYLTKGDPTYCVIDAHQNLSILRGC